MTEFENRIRDSFSRQTMMQTLGARLQRIAEGRVAIEAPILPGALQQQGAGHAGLLQSSGWHPLVAFLPRRGLTTWVRLGVRLAKGLRFGPVDESLLRFPHRMRDVSGAFLGGDTPKQVEFGESRHLVQVGLPVSPVLLKHLFPSWGHPEAVHRDVHVISRQLLLRRLTDLGLGKGLLTAP